MPSSNSPNSAENPHIAPDGWQFLSAIRRFAPGCGIGVRRPPDRSDSDRTSAGIRPPSWWRAFLGLAGCVCSGEVVTGIRGSWERWARGQLCEHFGGPEQAVSTMRGGDEAITRFTNTIHKIHKFRVVFPTSLSTVLQQADSSVSPLTSWCYTYAIGCVANTHTDETKWMWIALSMGVVAAIMVFGSTWGRMSTTRWSRRRWMGSRPRKGCTSVVFSFNVTYYKISIQQYTVGNMK